MLRVFFLAVTLLLASRYASSASQPVESIVPVLVGAGDIARCGREAVEATAKLLDGIPGTVFTAGDNVYERGTLDEYRRCYESTWGRHKARTRPAPGNHDYRTEAAAGYFDYFGAAAGKRGEGWYSYDIGGWHVVVLNSNCAAVGCGADSAQLQWLAADLAASSAKCTLAYWHHPRWGGGSRRPEPGVQAFWDVLYEKGAELVINGHDHFYERIAPVDPKGVPNPARGIRQITVGTGGGSLYEFEKPPLPITEVRDDKTYGVLKLSLNADGYDWQFVGVPGSLFSDSGSAACH
ncbi:MAG: metallophosphoesterase [Betaproteobacteria bacterium]|nr:MAG: metallophosphoesterase [Betaproteobacteria bacterium]